MLLGWVRGRSRNHFREGYLRRDQNSSWGSRGLWHRKVNSISLRSTAIAIDRKGVTAVLLLKPVAGVVSLAGLEHWLPPNSGGETTGMTSPTEADSCRTPGLFLLSQGLRGKSKDDFRINCLETPISKVIVYKLPNIM